LNINYNYSFDFSNSTASVVQFCLLRCASQPPL